LFFFGLQGEELIVFSSGLGLCESSPSSSLNSSPLMIRIFFCPATMS